MNFLPLLRKPLKSDEIIDMLEHWDVDVIYSFDRDHENLPDEYYAPIPQEGFQLVFDDKQWLRTVFVHLISTDGFQPADLSDSDLEVFPSKTDVAAHATTHSIRISEGRAELFGVERDWIRLDFDDHSIHYEFRHGQLGMITISATNGGEE